MMKIKILLITAVLFAALPSGCGTRIVHCDNCGKEIKVKVNSNVTEEWILFCDECGDPAEDLFN